MPEKTDLEKILRKIRKLFRLAESAGTESEASNAAFHARELLAKYDLSMSDVGSFCDEECTEEFFVFKRRSFPAYGHLLANAMCMMFNCQAFISDNKQSIWR